MKRRTRQSPVVSSTVRLPPPPPLPTTEPELLQFIGELMQRTDPRKVTK